jgi:hypothetical protein
LGIGVAAGAALAILEPASPTPRANTDASKIVRISFSSVAPFPSREGRTACDCRGRKRGRPTAVVGLGMSKQIDSGGDAIERTIMPQVFRGSQAYQENLEELVTVTFIACS